MKPGQVEEIPQVTVTGTYPSASARTAPLATVAKGGGGGCPTAEPYPPAFWQDVVHPSRSPSATAFGAPPGAKDPRMISPTADININGNEEREIIGRSLQV